jgi:outer membrane protein assembly factor BamA
MSFGVGYRRTDLWRERLGFRGTARMTPQLAYMLDAEVDFQGLATDRFFVDFYMKLESSPQMDYYGQGADSSLDDRTSYTYDDFSTDFRAGYDILPSLRVGATIGTVAVHTGPGNRSGVPSLEEVFDEREAPGFGIDTWYSRWGGFIEIDYRDLPSGPRSGGYYSTTVRQYTDEEHGLFDFSQLVFEVQQYIPYSNKNRVIAVRVLAEITSEEGVDDSVIPFYLQPKLGGNDNLRGFQRYRFYDNQALIVNVEHRWHASSALDMAIFVDFGKVAPRLRDVDFSDFDWNAGIGFRFKVNDAYIMRIDFAAGREGFRWMWTFSDIFKTKWGIY